MTTISILAIQERLIDKVGRSDMNDDILAAVQDATSDVCDELDWPELIATANFTTVSGAESYVLSTATVQTDIKTVLGLRYGNPTTGAGWNCSRRGEAHYRDLWGVNISLGIPTDYMEMPEGTVYLAPKPDGVYTFEVRYVKEQPTGASDVVAALFSRAIQELAHAYVLTDYLDMPELAVPHAALYNAHLRRLMARRSGGDRVYAVQYRDL